MFVSNCISEGHALFVAVDGAVLQSDLVHAVSGGGGLCLMRLVCQDLCFNIRILRVSLATTYDVVERYTYGNFTRMPPGPVPRRVWLKQRGRPAGGAFLAFSRFWVARARRGVSEVKKKGGAHHSSCPVLFPIFLTALLATCSLTRGKVSVGMFRDRSDPLTDYLRKAVPLSARKDTRFTSSSKGRCK